MVFISIHRHLWWFRKAIATFKIQNANGGPAILIPFVFLRARKRTFVDTEWGIAKTAIPCMQQEMAYQTVASNMQRHYGVLYTLTHIIKK